MKSLLLGLLLSLPAFAQQVDYGKFPCSSYNGSSEIDVNNSDDLFFAGHRLIRINRNLEAIDCLNRAKTIAPAYLDVRLELINAFAQLSDVTSANLETNELYEYEMNAYYQDLLKVYRNKVNHVVAPKPSHPVYKFKPVVNVDLGRIYRRLVKDEVIKEEVELKKSVMLMDTGKFKEAEVIVDRLVKLNPSSPTTHFYAGICKYQREKREESIALLKKAAELSYADNDIVMIIARNLNWMGAYKKAYDFLTSYKKNFVSYGCFQYGVILHTALSNIPGAKASEVDSLLNKSLDNKDDPRLCTELRKY